MISSGGGYVRKATLSTEQGNVWECKTAGNNCKISRVSFDANWLARNKEFAFLPNNDDVISTQVEAYGVLFETKLNGHYGVVFE